MPPRREVVDPSARREAQKGALYDLSPTTPGLAHLAPLPRANGRRIPRCQAMPRHVTFPREPRRSVSRAAAKSAFVPSRGLYEARISPLARPKPHDPRQHSPAESRQTHEKGHRSASNTRDDKSIVWNGKRARRAVRGQCGDLGKERDMGACLGRYRDRD